MRSEARLFPIPLLEKDSLDFSFSGLKSAALREVQKRSEESGVRSEIPEPAGLSESDI